LGDTDNVVGSEFGSSPYRRNTTPRLLIWTRRVIDLSIGPHDSTAITPRESKALVKYEQPLGAFVSSFEVISEERDVGTMATSPGPGD
jgi:hypothetical protein